MEQHIAYGGDADRVRALTASSINRRLDAETEHNLRLFSSAEAEPIARRIRALDREWDIARTLETEASAMGLIGLALALAKGRTWILMPGMVSGMMMLHALAGPYPMLPLFRRLGIRTRKEIEREKYALKAVRGDFEPVRTLAGDARAEAAWRAVTVGDQPEQTDRVRAHTPESVNERLESRTEEAVRSYARGGEAGIAVRIRELDEQWDMERLLQLNAGAAAMTGLTLGATVNRRWFALPGVVFSFLMQHALQGWCPPVSLFRRLGVRTRQEINRERYALKALRGDFDQVPERQPERTRTF